jgi:hypothetical protein
MTQARLERMYSAGDCSVCASAGAVVFVARVGAAELFFACPECGCAWRNPPTPFQVDTIDPPSAFAPQGFTVATLQEIRAAGLDNLIRQRDIELSATSFSRMAGFRPRDDTAAADDDVVDNVLRLPRDLQAGGMSPAALVAASGYAQRPAALTLAALAAEFRRDPALIGDWLSYSESKRVSSGWYLSRASGDRWLVGFYTTGPEHAFTEAAEACATFVSNEVAALARDAG